MNDYKDFVFKDYRFDVPTKTLKLYYSLEDKLEFCESYTLSFDLVNYNPGALDKAFQTLFFMAGVSYYKTYVPQNIIIKKGSLNSFEADFFSKTYQKGLGEFWYINQLDPRTEVIFPVNNTSEATSFELDGSDGALIGLGGGKDSIVVAEALRGSGLPLATWSLSHRVQLEPLAKAIGLNHFFVDRQIDPKLLELKDKGAMNGHVPISAIIAAVGLVVAILSGKKDVVVGNEQSSNDPTLNYKGVDINHQYSKSQEFERDFQRYLASNYGDSVRFYSFLRPLSELRITELFTKVGFDKYRGLFSSCNRAYTLSSKRLFWCGECPKCAFIFLAFTPFVERQKLEELWGGKNLLLDPALIGAYKQQLGISGDKPLDCVGEVREARAAMRLAQEIYPELKERYSFDIPQDYDYKSLSSDEMPEDIKQLFDSFISKY